MSKGSPNPPCTPLDQAADEQGAELWEQLQALQARCEGLQASGAQVPRLLGENAALGARLEAAMQLTSSFEEQLAAAREETLQLLAAVSAREARAEQLEGALADALAASQQLQAQAEAAAGSSWGATMQQQQQQPQEQQQQRAQEQQQQQWQAQLQAARSEAAQAQQDLGTEREAYAAVQAALARREAALAEAQVALAEAGTGQVRDGDGEAKCGEPAVCLGARAAAGPLPRHPQHPQPPRASRCPHKRKSCDCAAKSHCTAARRCLHATCCPAPR